ncbi:MAG: DUF397 domain-containing protein [Chloroflexi bacterium]|nr:DUF397 domain-containing protein [Chloroflexota bacterium]
MSLELNVPHKSSYSGAGGCVEATRLPDHVVVEHSSHKFEPLIFTAHEWRAFIEGARAGEFDL